MALTAAAAGPAVAADPAVGGGTASLAPLTMDGGAASGCLSTRPTPSPCRTTPHRRGTPRPTRTLRGHTTATATTTPTPTSTPQSTPTTTPTPTPTTMLTRVWRRARVWCQRAVRWTGRARRGVTRGAPRGSLTRRGACMLTSRAGVTRRRSRQRAGTRCGGGWRPPPRARRRRLRWRPTSCAGCGRAASRSTPHTRAASRRSTRQPRHGARAAPRGCRAPSGRERLASRTRKSAAGCATTASSGRAAATPRSSTRAGRRAPLRSGRRGATRA